MPNRYANLIATNKIKDEWDKINDGFQNVQDEMDTLPVGLYRNALINGNFDIWQRGTSFTSFTNIGAYSCDRWVYARDGSGQAQTVSRQSFAVGQAEVPNEPKYFARVDITTAATSQTFNVFYQRVESVRTFAGKQVTLSFYAKSDSNRTLNTRLSQQFGSGGSSSVGVLGSNCDVTTSWQKFSITFTLPSISGKTVGSDDYVSVEIGMPQNTACTIDIAQVQLCAGDVDYPFQPRSVPQELTLCQRYYWKTFALNTAPGQASSDFNNAISYVVVTSGAGIIKSVRVSFPVRMRIAPTLTFYNPINANTNWYNRNASADSGVSGAPFGDSGETGFTVNNTQVAGDSTQQTVYLHATADAEL